MDSALLLLAIGELKVDKYLLFFYPYFYAIFYPSFSDIYIVININQNQNNSLLFIYKIFILIAMYSFKIVLFMLRFIILTS